MGAHSYGSIKNSGGDVSIGKYCSIAGGVTAVILNDHCVNWVSTYPFRKTMAVTNAAHPVARQNSKIIIENDVWIGQNATLLEDTILRNGVVVGSHSVVHGEIPAYCVAVGNPARIVKKRFSDEEIESLLNIQWWDWPEDKVKVYAPLLCSDNIKEFIEKATEDSIQWQSQDIQQKPIIPLLDSISIVQAQQ